MESFFCGLTIKLWLFIKRKLILEIFRKFFFRKNCIFKKQMSICKLTIELIHHHIIFLVTFNVFLSLSLNPISINVKKGYFYSQLFHYSCVCVCVYCISCTRMKKSNVYCPKEKQQQYEKKNCCGCCLQMTIFFHCGGNE